MKRTVITILLALSCLISCTTQGGVSMTPEAGMTDAPLSVTEPAIFFITRDAGIVTLETIGGEVFMTVPRTSTFLAPMKSYVSSGGEPIFVSGEEGVNVKVYRDAVYWSHWGRAEYAPWFFTESPKDFYLKF